MCGIGLVIGKNEVVRKDLINLINIYQKNRGPDFSQIKSFENLSLCHQRLSIVGLDSKYNQPFFYKNQVLLFNGEIYNFRSIARSYNLSKDAYISDTACLAELFDKLGFDRSIKIIDGMYSICLLNLESQLINICVDDFGIKQLYYSEVMDNIVIASTVKPILEIFKKYNCKLTLDQKTKIWKTSFHGAPPEHTHIEQIRQFNQYSTYQINLKNKVIKTYSKDELVSFRSRTFNLSKNLKDAANADVNASLLLSGGVDSTALLCSASSFKNSISCVTIDNSIDDNSGFSSNDSKNASINAKDLGFKIENIKLNNIEKNDLMEIFDIIDVPSEVTGSIPLYFLCKNLFISKKNIKYLISGLGADEIFLGYRGHRLSFLLSIIPEFILQNLFQNVEKLFNLINFPGFQRRINFIRYIFSKSPDERDSSIFSFTKTNKNAISIWKNYFYKNNQSHKKLFIKKYYERCFDFFLAQCHLPASDRISMAFSYELRLPFLQKRILSAFKPRNNIELLLKSLIRKSTLIKYINKILKNKYRKIPKSGFGADSKYLFSEESLEFLDNLIKYGNQKGFIKEQINIQQTCDQRLFIHLINQAHYVHLLRKIIE